MTIEVRPLATALGAEVSGVDLARPLDDETVTALRQAWRQYLVLVFHDQPLTHEQHVNFTRRFGELDDHSAIPKFRDPVVHEILNVRNDEVGGRRQPVGRQWHSDLSITLRPSRGAMLRCEVRPPVGGDTMFANACLAYETLSEPLRAMIDKLSAVHDIAAARQNRGRSDLAEARLRTPPVVHPMVRTHPETGKKALFVNEMSTCKIIGLSDTESESILKLLFAHTARPENTYRHRWEVNDLVIWDNESTQHLALDDYDINVPRIMYRTTLLGGPSGRLATPDEWA